MFVIDMMVMVPVMHTVWWVWQDCTSPSSPYMMIHQVKLLISLASQISNDKSKNQNLFNIHISATTTNKLALLHYTATGTLAFLCMNIDTLES